MIKKARILLSVPFILIAAIFKIMALVILPKEYREEAKEVL